MLDSPRGEASFDRREPPKACRHRPKLARPQERRRTLCSAASIIEEAERKHVACQSSGIHVLPRKIIDNSSPHAAFAQDLSPQALYTYISRARNILYVLSSSLSESHRDFAREFDLEFDDRGSNVIDHFSYDKLLDVDGSHSTIVVPLDSTPSPFISTETAGGAPILYRGVGHQVGKQPLLSNILSARETSYSADTNPKEPLVEDPFVSGTSVGLVSAMQAKNNARVTFVGSMELFSDEFINAKIEAADGTSYPKSGNLAFINDLTRWTFQESGILRLSSPHLRRAIDGKALPLYRVRDELDYSIEVSTLSPSGLWAPFPSGTDFQFEFTMLDPHLLLPLPLSPSTSASATSSLLATRFRTPDRHGVFTLKVDYRRPGWTWLEEKMVVSVTPPRHDEFDRFITGAWPFYAGAASVSAATLVFATVWTLG
ncbi:oligosaccharyltransferase complex subunit beta, partial [Phenoliferia sp. Uapishka_3]